MPRIQRIVDTRHVEVRLHLHAAFIAYVAGRAAGSGVAVRAEFKFDCRRGTGRGKDVEEWLQRWSVSVQRKSRSSAGVRML